MTIRSCDDLETTRFYLLWTPKRLPGFLFSLLLHHQQP
jgi:hypothetical protein